MPKTKPNQAPAPPADTPTPKPGGGILGAVSAYAKFQGLQSSAGPVFTSQWTHEPGRDELKAKLDEAEADIDALRLENARLQSQMASLIEAGTRADDLIAENVAMRAAFGHSEPCVGCQISEPFTWEGGQKLHTGEQSNGGVTIRCPNERLAVLERAVDAVQAVTVDLQGPGGTIRTLACPHCSAVAPSEGPFEHDETCQVARLRGWPMKQRRNLTFRGIPFVSNPSAQRNSTYLYDLGKSFTITTPPKADDKVYFHPYPAQRLIRAWFDAFKPKRKQR